MGVGGPIVVGGVAVVLDGAGAPLGGGAVGTGVAVWLGGGGGGVAGLLCAIAQLAQLRNTNSVVIRVNMMTSESKYDYGHCGPQKVPLQSVSNRQGGSAIRWML